MKLHSMEENGITIIDVIGTVDTYSVPELSSFLIQTIEKCETGHKILLDLTLTDYMGSAGLCVLTVAHQQAFAKGILLSICSPGNAVTNLLNVVHLKQVFAIYKTRLEALQKMSA